MLTWPPAAPIPGNRRATPLSVSTLTLIFPGKSRKDGKSSHRTTFTIVSPNEARAARTRLRRQSTRRDQRARILPSSLFCTTHWSSVSHVPIHTARALAHNESVRSNLVARTFGNPPVTCHTKFVVPHKPPWSAPSSPFSISIVVACTITAL